MYGTIWKVVMKHVTNEVLVNVCVFDDVYVMWNFAILHLFSISHKYG